MSVSTVASSLISAVAQKLGVTPEHSEEDHLSIFSFEEIDILVAHEGEAIILSARIGTVPADRPELVEALLSANLYWQETAGATLSLEPFSRAALIARRIATVELNGPEDLEAALDEFGRAAITWTRTLDILSTNAGATDPPPTAEKGFLASRV